MIHSSSEILSWLALLLIVGCGTVSVEGVIAPAGSVLEIDGARLTIPENCVADSTMVTIEKKEISHRNYEQGYTLLGDLYSITPETLFFKRPVLFSIPVTTENISLGVRIGDGFVPIADAVVSGETLQTNIWHGGEYYVVQKPEEYGINDHCATDEGLLIVSDPYVGDYITRFKSVMKQGGYDFPIWTFVYPSGKSIEENALLLADELKKLHEEYGNFRLDIVSFGIGGLITHRYLADDSLYQKDLSPAVISVGTPFFGSSFAIMENIRNSKSPYRFFFLDCLGDNMKDLKGDSEFAAWMLRHRNIRGGGLKDPKEDKNPASIRGKYPFPGDLPEEKEGDGLVSLSSTLLTPIEPEPFSVDHFGLYHADDVHETVREFVLLYRTYAFLDFILAVWEEKDPMSTINDLWEREIKLNFRKSIDFEVLLEFNNNMLKSSPENAILITNGDNDTYPAWYLQQRGVRNDVIILNRNLFNIKEYVLFLQKIGLPLTIEKEALEKLRPYYKKGKKGKKEIVTPSDYLIKLLLEQSDRPVVFSTTVYNPENYGYPLKLSGLVYEIGDEDIDIERTEALLHREMTFDKLLSISLDSLSMHNQNLSKNYAAVAFQLSLAYEELKHYRRALQEIEFARRFGDEGMFSYNEAMIYLNMGEQDTADSIFRKVLRNPSSDLETKKQIAAIYRERMDMTKEAIRILAECLREHPDDKEIPELIRKYQEEQ